MNHSKRIKTNASNSRTGTEKQHLDMLEGGDSGPRGDDVSYSPDEAAIENAEQTKRGADEMMGTFNVDMSEEGREGDELSGDEHSSGMQGSDTPEDYLLDDQENRSLTRRKYQ